METDLEEIQCNCKKRRPWLAFLLSFLAPGLGQLYNGQPKKFLIILFYYFVLVPLSIFFALMGFTAFAICVILGICIFIFILIEAAFSARKVKRIKLRWYNKWYIYCIMVVLFGNTVPHVNYVIGKHVILPFVHPFKITSGSMHPTIQIGDRIIVDMTYTSPEKIRRGDVLLIQNEPNYPYIKRVLALPSEQIQIKDETVHVNGKPVYESWQLNYSPNPDIKYWNEVRAKYAVKSPYKVPVDKIFLLGDNRAYSVDSRHWGAVDVDKIKGKVLYIFWSDDPNRIGKRIE